jgi:hypothetical protein
LKRQGASQPTLQVTGPGGQYDLARIVIWDVSGDEDVELNDLLEGIRGYDIKEPGSSYSGVDSMWVVRAPRGREFPDRKSAFNQLLSKIKAWASRHGVKVKQDKADWDRA